MAERNRVPLVSLEAQHAALAGALADASQRVIASGRFILGPEVEAFEREIATYLGVKHAIGVSSGTDALVCALLALGIGPGDEVVTSAYGFVATAEAVARVGATPRFVDIDPSGFNLDPGRVADATSPRTRAILPAHLFGHPADLEPLNELGGRSGIAVIEDAAQAMGATWLGVNAWEEVTERQARRWSASTAQRRAGDFPAPPSQTMVSAGLEVTDEDRETLISVASPDPSFGGGERDTLVGRPTSVDPVLSPVGPRRAGSVGTLGCFSFFPSKTLGALGDGGLVVTGDDLLAARVRRLRQHGASAKHWYTEIGGNYRLDALQAALLRVKLPHLDGWLALRRAHVAAYEAALADLSGLELPRAAAFADPAWAHYVVRVKDGRRDAVARALEERGIETAIYYPVPLPLQPAFSYLGHRAGDFPEAERAAAECLAIPLFPELRVEERERVIRALRECLGRR